MVGKTFENLDEYTSVECKAWNDLLFYYIYENKIPKFPYPSVSSKVAFKLVTNFSRKDFKEFYAPDYSQ